MHSFISSSLKKTICLFFLIKWPCLYTFQLHHFLMDFRDLWNTSVLSFQRNDIKIWVQTLLQLIHVSFNFWSRSYTFKTCLGVLLFFYIKKKWVLKWVFLMHIIVQIYNLIIRSTTLISKGVQYHLKILYYTRSHR